LFSEECSPRRTLSQRYLDDHRDEYYDRLLAVSRDGDWTGWCGFFLRAVIEQSQTNQSRAQAILSSTAPERIGSPT